MERRLWNREETIIVFNLYCKIPFKNSSKSHPEVIKVANIIGRTPSAVNMKIGNFGRLDPKLKRKNISGLVNGSKLDEEIWNEFNNNWDKLSYESENLVLKYSKNKDISEMYMDESFPVGSEKIVTIKQRINQGFFRKTVLSAYNISCCVTGISNSELLIASHIKPWRDSTDSERTNPTNGLCLNALHDKAFDKGFMTIDDSFRIRISESLTDIYDGSVVRQYFKSYNNKQIIMPDKFIPNKEFLQYHNDVIYESWK